MIVPKFSFDGFRDQNENIRDNYETTVPNE